MNFLDDKVNEKIKHKKGMVVDHIPLESRYFGFKRRYETGTPLIKHPCVHWIGSYKYW